MSVMLAMAALLVSPLLSPQGEGSEKGPAAPTVVERSAATKPIRFATVPVADEAPLDPQVAVARAVAQLLTMPEGEGDQWPYEGVYREDRGQLPVGYRVGGTAIVCLGLLAAPGCRDDEARMAALHKGLRFVLATLDHERMDDGFVGSYDVRGWGHIYALSMLLHLREARLAPAELEQEVEQKAGRLVRQLCESAIPESGGWNYSRRAGYRSSRNPASTFMTAPALQVLFHAQGHGFPVDEMVVEQALAALERARSQQGGYGYGAPRRGLGETPDDKLSMMDKVGSSAARAPLVEATLALAGRGDELRLRQAIGRFFTHWDDLAVRKSQPGTHIPPYGIAPYYFLFGHAYVAQAIEMLPDGDDKDALRQKLRSFLARSIDYDGTWNDRQFERSAGYGTAMAILALRMPDIPKPRRYSPPARKKGVAEPAGK
jgi:hypothetical protein